MAFSIETLRRLRELARFGSYDYPVGFETITFKGIPWYIDKEPDDKARVGARRVLRINGTPLTKQKKKGGNRH